MAILLLGRSQRHSGQGGSGMRSRLVALVVLPLVAVASTEIGRLFLQHPTLADVLFTLGLGLSVWLRRFGPWGTRIGALIVSPFLAVLVTPVPVLPVGQPSLGRSMLRSAVAAVIAFLWVWIVQEAAARVGVPPASSAGGGSAPARSGSRMQTSDRMAVQLTLSLALAFVIGREVFPTHWTWIVLTAFIVNSGNRGRGDVLHKSVMRIVGASAGTVAATLLTGLFPTHDAIAVAVILVVLALGNWLRTFSYTYWAACITAVLALLQGYFGENDIGLIGERLLQIVLGGVLSVAVAWFILPVRSRQVLRRRLADVLASLTDALVAAQRSHGEVGRHQRSFGEGLAALEQVAPTFIAHRRMQRLRRVAIGHPADAIDAVRGCAEPLSVLAAEAERNPHVFAEPAVASLLKAVTGNVVAARRFIGRRPEAQYRRPADKPGQQSVVIAALTQIDAHMRVICELGGVRSYGGERLAHTQRSKDAPGGDPREAGPGHVQQDQPGGQAGEVLRVADGGLSR